MKLSNSCSFYLDRTVFIDRYMKSEPNGPFQFTFGEDLAQIIG